MNNLEIEILIKKHEARIKILNEIKSVNKDIEIYFYLTSGIKKFLSWIKRKMGIKNN